MAKGIDESLYIGSAVKFEDEKKTTASEEKQEKLSDNRKNKLANLRMGAKELIKIIDEQIKVFDSLTDLRAQSESAMASGRSVREALSDQLIYNAGQINSLRTLKMTLEASLNKGVRRG